jgi:hypothetical protein
MNEYTSNRLLRTLAALLPAVALTTLAAGTASGSSDEDHTNTTTLVVKGFAVTGHNDVLGKPAFDWGPPFGTFGFVTIGAYNPDGPMPIRLSEDMPKSTLMATMIDPNVLAATGVSLDEVDLSWLNVPLREVPVHYSFGKTKPFLGLFDTDPSEKGQAMPMDPITIERWMKASGVAKIVCESDHRASLKLQMKDLIPNRMYGVWSTLGPSKRGDAEVFPSIAVGGTPNIFVTDKAGNATYEREMQFCPMRPETTDRAMLVINVQLHSNHQNYGGINGPPIERLPGAYWIGTVIHNHLQFPINVTMLQ